MNTAYGIMAEFDNPEALVRAAREAHNKGYRKMDAYAPIPVHGLAEAIGLKRSRLPWLIGLGGLVGGCSGFFMQWFASAVHLPLNIGGRPLNSWPSFIPITYELTILVASLSAVCWMFGLNRLPELYHPVFNDPRFQMASRDRFFLCIEGVDPLFNASKTTDFLKGLGALSVAEVPVE
jgi:hypothetical protein